MAVVLMKASQLLRQVLKAKCQKQKRNPAMLQFYAGSPIVFQKIDKMIYHIMAAFQLFRFSSYRF